MTGAILSAVASCTRWGGCASTLPIILSRAWPKPWTAIAKTSGGGAKSRPANISNTTNSSTAHGCLRFHEPGIWREQALMCGIFGIFARTIDPTAFQALGELNTARGNRAFGVLLFDGAVCTVTRRVGPFDASAEDVSHGSVLLGHVRAPTDGHADDPAAVHPFETRDVYLAHNGLLLNHDDFAHWRIPSMAALDSTVIAGGIQRQMDNGRSIVEAIRQTVEPLDGQQA